MELTDRNRFAACLLACSEMYGKSMSNAVVGVWWNALKAYNIEAVESAFGRHISNTENGQFMPKPADILRMLEGTSEESALVAWAKVDKAIRSVGPYASVAFDDPLVHRVLQDMGGWIGLGEKDDEAWPFVGNEFRNRYRGYRSRHEIPEYPRTLIGISEAFNAAKGHAIDGVVLIGEPLKAAQVRDGGVDKPMIGIDRQPKIGSAILRLAGRPTTKDPA